MATVQLPSNNTLQKAAQMSIELDKPICLDYFVASCNKECKIARDGPNGDKFLYKSPEEYTSPLKSMFKIAGVNGDTDDFIF